jgi:predicted unusual protein kinase regulating ubiquinone biosynthesis (AarF/ABC1/UbiB family)
MTNLIHNLYNRCKYFVYFSLFINAVTMNKINYIFTNKINHTLIKYLYNTINLNGCMLIKLVQLINTNIELLDIRDDDNFIRCLFSSFYENCNIHELSYTRQVFIDEYCDGDEEEFENKVQLDIYADIKSGSMAQVYKGIYENQTVAFKVVHPEIEYQLIYPMMFVKFYKFMVSNISFLNKYDTPFIFDNFFQNLRKQSDMRSEYRNMSYFYNEYIDNQYVLIPKPIASSKNILIMEYVEGVSIDEITDSIIEKQKIAALLNLFIKDNYYFKDYYHSDLHESNWKVKKYNDFYQLIVYDYGYISKNNIQETFKLVCFYNDTLNVTGLCGCVYEQCLNIKFNQEQLVIRFNNYINNLNIQIRDREPLCEEILLRMYNFLVINNISVTPSMFELFVSTILIKKYIILYLLIEKVGNSNSDNIINGYLGTINLCKKYQIFPKLKDYYIENYIQNTIFNNTHLFKNNFFDELEGDETIDI